MTTEQIKKRIKQQIIKEHGTMSAFARASKIDRYELQKMFIRKSLTEEEQKRLKKALSEAEPESKELSPDKLELLRSKIQEAGGVYRFSKDTLDENENPLFEVRHVYDAYNGRFTSKSAFLIRLLKHFSI